MRAAREAWMRVERNRRFTLLATLESIQPVVRDKYASASVVATEHAAVSRLWRRYIVTAGAYRTADVAMSAPG